MTARPIRIGAVSYLNTKPLVYRLAEFAPGAEIVLAVPSRLADWLAAGEIDIGLIPSVEYFREYVREQVHHAGNADSRGNPPLRIVSTACIGCRGPVLSVQLYFRRPPREIRSLALDAGSRTSAALAQVLLAEVAGTSEAANGRSRAPLDLIDLPLAADPHDSPADAILVIGDRAIPGRTDSLDPARFHEVWDLGAEWVRRTSLPFVFAMWVAREDSEIPRSAIDEIEGALDLARDSGVANLEAIARAEAANSGMSEDACLRYLRDNLHFYLGSAELAGLETFARRAAALGLIPSNVPLGSPATHRLPVSLRLPASQL